MKYKLKIFTLITDRDNNGFSELAKTFRDVKYVYCKDNKELEDDYSEFIKNNKEYIDIPEELDNRKSEKILNDLINKIDEVVDYDEVWFTVEDSLMLARAFSNRGKKLNILFLTDKFDNIQLKINKRIKEDYYISCEPDYPNYRTNCYLDGKLFKYIKDIKDVKILVWNKL